MSVLIKAVGIYVGAGNVKDTGYVFMGNVTEDDIASRT